MNDNKYNGWINYATWRVNLEIFDGLSLSDMGWQKLDEYDLAEALKDHVDEVLFCDIDDTGLAADYARAFLQDVSWREIAQHMICDFEDDEADVETAD